MAAAILRHKPHQLASCSKLRYLIGDTIETKDKAHGKVLIRNDLPSDKDLAYFSPCLLYPIEPKQHIGTRKYAVMSVFLIGGINGIYQNTESKVKRLFFNGKKLAE